MVFGEVLFQKTTNNANQRNLLRKLQSNLSTTRSAMLARASRRHAQHRLSGTVATSFAQIQLPWLCPAVLHFLKRKLPVSRASSTACSRPRASPSRSSSPSRSTTRPLATAVDNSQYGSLDDFIPFEHIPGAESGGGVQSKRSSVGQSSLKEFDFSKLLLLPAHESGTVPQVKIVRGTGITGDTADLQQNLYACVRVGRMDRAAALARRLGRIYISSAPELQDAHSQYLLGLLDDLLSAPNREKYTAMQKWFELEIRAKDVPSSGTILAVMIKATIHVLDGTRLERTLRRYISYADLAGVEADALSSSIFTEAELNRILRLMPERYEKPNEIVVAEQEVLTLGNDLQPTPTAGALSAVEGSTNDILELRAHTQRGFGLSSLRNSMKSMISDNESGDSLRGEEKVLQARQMMLEKDTVSSALERWKEEAEITQQMRARGRLSNPKLGTYVHEWIKELVLLVNAEIKLSEEAEHGDAQADDVPRMIIGPLLKIMPADKLCAVAVLSYVSICANKIPDAQYQQAYFQRSALTAEERSLTKLVRHVGDAVSQEMTVELYRADMLRKLNNLPSSERRKKLAKLSKRQGTRYRPRLPSARDDQLSKDDNAPPQIDFTRTIKMTLGAFFVSLLIKVAKLPITKLDPRTGEELTHAQPVLTQAVHWHGGKKITMVRTNPELLKRLRHEPVGHFIAKSLPMLTEPRKWTSIDSSPYLATPMDAIRFKDRSNSQKEYARRASKSGSLDQVFAGLDVIGKVPWRINAPVFRTLSHLWNTGAEIAGLAPEETPHEIPPEPITKDYKAYFDWKTKVQRIQNDVQGNHSKRCFQNFQLEVARSYLNDVFYCPHSVDFRGRAYPIPPYFNHMGSDPVRGLFIFAKGKELGEHGLYWLKIHLANMYGYDKQSLSERAQFAMDHVGDIYDSATNPLDGKRWWLTSDDPWQTLAACIELKNALEAPVPEKFVSHLPVQQDGTCNGLQHYAALGGDMIGAQQVNLIPGDKPADIYSAVADLVKESVSRDAEKGHLYAQVVNGYITRKVVKQPVMTNVYGVTAHGARGQVAKQLRDSLPKAILDTQLQVIRVSSYVTDLIFDALNKMFNGAQAIQVWLGECGSRISSAVTPEQIRRIQGRREGERFEAEKFRRSLLGNFAELAAKEDYQFKSTIVWTTPLGLPVVQPYRKQRATRIKTNLQDIYLQTSTLSDPVEKRKQLQAFPPNFIHSLDATHMMLSALKCDEIGLQFAAVHDSFWTHAGDVPTMNRVLRDAFVRMHSEDIIGRLRQEFTVRYAGCYRWAPLRIQSELGQRIFAYRKDRGKPVHHFRKAAINANAPVEELVEEYERAQLLKSLDPDDIAKAQAMETPCSIIDELGPEALADALLAEADVSQPDVQVLGNKDSVGPVADDDAVSVPGVNADDYFESSDLAVFEDAVSDETVAPTTSSEEPIDAAEDATAESEDADEMLSESATHKCKSQKVGRRNGIPKIFVWLPLEFPPAPPKGGFDVAKLKESQYFFS